MMMSIINLGAILEYGRPSAVLRRIAGIGGRDGISARTGVSPVMAASSAGRVKLMAKKADDDDKKMDVDDEDSVPRRVSRRPDAMDMSPALSEAAASSGPEVPPPLKLAMQFTFSMLAHALRSPMRKSSPFARPTLNPHITIMLTFLATAVKDPQALAVLERFIPWADLSTFLTAIPRRVMFREQQKERSESAVLLTSGCKPLPEDWCLRGLGWGGKRVYPMGFWGKEVNVEDRNVEVEVLDKSEAGDQMDGIIEDEREENEAANELGKRWVRVARAGLKIAKHVNGFVYYPAATEEQRCQWKIEGALAAKVTRWQEEERREREEEEARLRGRRWDEDSMDVDEEDCLAADDLADETEDDETDTPEIKALKVSFFCALMSRIDELTSFRIADGICRLSWIRHLKVVSLHLPLDDVPEALSRYGLRSGSYPATLPWSSTPISCSPRSPSFRLSSNASSGPSLCRSLLLWSLTGWPPTHHHSATLPLLRSTTLRLTSARTLSH